jgi:hypothetical protein
MKVVLRRRLAPLLESKKKLATVYAQNPQCTKENVRSSWADSIAGDAYEKKQGSGVPYGKSIHADSFSSPQSYEKKGVSPYNSAIRRAAAMKDEVQTEKMKTVSSVRLSSVNQFAKQMAGPSNAKQMAGPFSKIFDLPTEQKKVLLPATAVKQIKVPLPAVEVQEVVSKVGSNTIVIHSAGDAHIGPLIDADIDTAANGLSMMAREVQCDGTSANLNGQRSNIFQSECKIQDKVCKLIIDGGSFTNAISSDLVHALSLSTRRLPTPRYMQWMNQSGTLKITHKARVKFSVGNYIDTVDCDVVPLSACHLLLGRSWQFDLDATHGGRCNDYLFVHKGVHHVLKPMPDSAIKAEVFATVKVKKNATASTPKPRTALLQEGENDVALSSEIIACESSRKELNPKVASASIFEDVSCGVPVQFLLQGLLLVSLIFQ